jgi:hypothetical protein
LLPEKRKCFLTNSETFLLWKQCFPVYPHVSSTLGIRTNKAKNGGKRAAEAAATVEKPSQMKQSIFRSVDIICFHSNVSQCGKLGNMEKQWKETMFPQECFLVCPGLRSVNNYMKLILITN